MEDLPVPSNKRTHNLNLEKFLDKMFIETLRHDFELKIKFKQSFEQHYPDIHRSLYICELQSPRLIKQFPQLFMEDMPFMRTYVAEETSLNNKLVSFLTSSDLFIGNDLMMNSAIKKRIYGSEFKKIEDENQISREIYSLIKIIIPGDKSKNVELDSETRRLFFEGQEYPVLKPKISIHEYLSGFEHASIIAAVDEFFKYFYGKKIKDQFQKRTFTGFDPE